MPGRNLATRSKPLERIERSFAVALVAVEGDEGCCCRDRADLLASFLIQERQNLIERENAWAELLDATPPGWYVGQPSYHDERQWVLYAFDPSEKPVVGVRKREWTAIAPSEL